MAKTSFTLTHGRASDYTGTASMSAREAVQRFERLMTGCLGGAYPGATGFTIGSGQATGTVTLDGDADAVTVTVGGIAVGPVAAAVSGGDAATAADVATAINADAGASALVFAESLDTVVTLTAIAPGSAGNLGLSASATLGSVTASGAALSGGSTDSYTF